MELKNLQEIFIRNYFRIPDYQRGYSWEQRHLRDLWRDINILEDGKDHYIGMLSVIEQKDLNHILIVDGQQRIATLIILIHVICHCEQMKDKKWVNVGVSTNIAHIINKYLYCETGDEEDDIESIFGYDKDNPSHIYFQKDILGLKVIPNAPKNTLYTHNLKKAKDFFEEKIKDMKFEELEKLLFKITEKLNFNYYIIKSEFNEFVAFETMNNRGKPLSSLELLKNRFIYLSTLLYSKKSTKDNLRKDINEAWKTIYEYLGRNFDDKLDDEDFLKTHWIMNFRYSRGKSNVYRDFLLNKHFTAEQVSDKVIKYTEIRNYAYDIQQAVKAYYYMHNPYDTEFKCSEEMKRWLFALNRLGLGMFKPLITSMLIDLISKDIEEEEEEEIIKILKSIERFSFVAFNIGFYAANYKNFNIYHRAHDYHIDKDKNSLTNIFDKMSVLRKPFNEEEFRQDVDYDFYEWKGIKYFLYEYELYLQETVGQEMKVKWTNMTIEHIFPQTPKKGEWNSFDNKNSLLHNLGNLLLLPRTTNSELSNKSFSEKKERYRNGSYSAIEVAKCKDWTPKAIKDREKDMLKFMVDRWELKKS